MKHLLGGFMCLLLVLGLGACAIEPTDSSSPSDLVAEAPVEDESLPSEELSVEEPPFTSDPPPPSTSDPVSETPPGESSQVPPASESETTLILIEEELPPPSEEPPPPSKESPPPSEESPPMITTSAWQLTMKVSVPDSAAEGGEAYNNLVAGTEQEATNEFDNSWDIRSLLAGPVEAYFTHEGEVGYAVGSQELWQDIREAVLPAEWAIKVWDESGRTVTLTWTLPTGEVSCATHRFILEDSDGLLAPVVLCATGSLSYVGDGQMRHFVLKVSLKVS